MVETRKLAMLMARTVWATCQAGMVHRRQLTGIDLNNIMVLSCCFPVELLVAQALLQGAVLATSTSPLLLPTSATMTLWVTGSKSTPVTDELQAV